MKLTTLLRPLLTLALAFPALAHGFEATIKKVSSDSITVRTGDSAGFKVTNIDREGKATKAPAQNMDTFKVTPETVISVDGLPSKLSDVKPDMKVIVNQGTDRTTASMITANTVPPKPKKLSKKEKAKLPKTMGKGVGTDQVLAISAERITFAQIGAGKARAHFITPTTVITVNGAKSSVDAIKTGMDVQVNARDGTTAASIVAEDASN